MPSSASRRYGGQDASQRAAARRERLLAAGLEAFGTDGFAATSVEALCTRSGVTARHLYEQFAGREVLLHAVYEQIMGELGRRVATALAAEDVGDPAARIRAGLEAFLRGATRDVRVARIMQLEVIGVSAALEERRAQARGAFAALIAGEARTMRGGRRVSRHDRLVAVALVGAVNELLLDWVAADAGSRASVRALVDVAVEVFEATLQR
jgi:AcrR family transcriptional regulator